MCGHDISQGSDGAPLYSFHTLKDLNPKQYIDTHIHSGPYLKSLNALGKMFSYTHLWHYLHEHRNMDNKKNFYLFPGDPGQTLIKQQEMTAPHYVAWQGHTQKNQERISHPLMFTTRC